MILDVFQKDEEAAKIKVNKVRKNVSACDIQLVYTGRGIGVGDLVIFKETPPIVKVRRPASQADLSGRGDFAALWQGGVVGSSAAERRLWRRVPALTIRVLRPPAGRLFPPSAGFR